MKLIRYLGINSYFCRKYQLLKLTIMALEPRGCPVLYGKTAERFVREAEEAVKSNRRDKISVTHEDIERIKKNTEEFLAKYGGDLKNVKFG